MLTRRSLLQTALVLAPSMALARVRHPSRLSWMPIPDGWNTFYAGTPEEIRMLSVGGHLEKIEEQPAVVIRYAVLQRPESADFEAWRYEYDISSGSRVSAYERKCKECIGSAPTHIIACSIADLHWQHKGLWFEPWV